MKAAVVTFPGSNCDRDTVFALRDILGCQVVNPFHRETSIEDCDAVVIPGGFSYGDYLRAGALAKMSPIMDAIIRFAEDGGLVLGICNGFQILCEAGLLPGALIRNRHLRFCSRIVNLRVENNRTPFTSKYRAGQIIRVPIAHAEGCYAADENTIRKLEDENRVIFRYIGPVREDVPDGNPNGSVDFIAGIINERGNVLGMMPHPERAIDPLITTGEGLRVLESMAEACVANVSRVSLT